MSQLGRLLGKFRSLRRRERRSCAKQDLGAETQLVYNEILDTVTANTSTSNNSSNTNNNNSNSNNSSSLKSILRKREAPSPSVRSPSVTPSPSLAPSVASTSRIRSD